MKFTEEMFRETGYINRDEVLTLEGAVLIANKILAKQLKDAKVVYLDDKEIHLSFVDEIGFTKRGYIVNIEELAKRECKHEPLPSLTWDTTCRRCGVLLEIIGWKEATR